MDEQMNKQKKLENKKRKAGEKEESTRGQINEYFPLSQKLKSPLALKKQTHIVTPTKKGPEEPKESKCKLRQLLICMS